MKTKSLIYLQTVAILILIFLLFKNCEDQPTKAITNFENSPHKLDRDTASKMEKLHIQKQYAYINDNLGYQDAREYWYPLKELKSYISYIEEKAEAANYDKNTLGIRVYNAAKKVDEPNGIKVKSALFFIGTYNTNVSTSKASMFNFNSSMQGIDENMDDISAFDYGSSGRPPRDFN